MKRIILATAFLWAALAANAQTTDAGAASWKSRIFFEASTVGGKRKNLSPFGIQWKLGYHFTDRFYGTANMEYLIGRYKSAELRTYYDNANLGVGIGYTILRPHNEWFSPCRNIDLRTNIGTTLGNNNWKYTFYEAGITLDTSNRNALVIGAGYRFIDSHTLGIEDFKGLFVSLGLRI